MVTKLCFIFSFLIFSKVALGQALPLYQVISQDPHHVAKFENYVRTVKRQGRLWLVNVSRVAPPSAYNYLRLVNADEVRNYFPSTIKRNLNTYDLWVKKVINQSSVENLKSDVEHLSAYSNRSAGHINNQQATLWLEQQFQKLGYQVKRSCYKENICSVIAQKLGNTKADEIILVEGHFDSVGKVEAGADDNATGTAALLEVARVLAEKKLNKTIQIFATNGEELGLLGATHYVNELVMSGEIKKIKLVINMDMVGYNSNGVVELETDEDFEPLAKWFAQLVADFTALTPKITLGAWGSDHVPFLKKGVPTLLTIEDWSTKTPCYHQSCDKPNTVNYEYLQEITKLNIAAVLTQDIL